MSVLWTLSRISAHEAKSGLLAVSNRSGSRLGGQEDGFELGRGWHILHYLLTESAEPMKGPLSSAIFGRHAPGGGDPVLPWRHPSGSLQSLLTPREVAEIVDALDTFPDSLIIERFDPAFLRFQSLYGFRGSSDADPEEEDRSIERYLHLLGLLRGGYRAIEEAEMGAAIHIG